MPRAGLDVNVQGVVLGTSASGSSSASTSVRWFSVLTYGAVGDGKQATDGVTASGSNVFNSASANFQNADIGKPIEIGQKLPAITGAVGTPITITANAHGLANGALVMIRGVQGNVAANGPWTVAGAAANTFQLAGSASSGGYTTGGTIYCPFVTTITGRNSLTQVALAANATANGAASTYAYGTDDTGAFQAASNAAALVNGTIYVPAPPAGTRYLVRHPPYGGGNSVACFRISSNCSLIGDGAGSIIQMLIPVSPSQVFDIMASTNSFYVGLGGSSGAAPSIIDQNITVSGVTFDGSRDMVFITGAGGGGTEHACYFSRTSNINFFNGGVQNCGADGIVYEFSQNCTVENVSSSNCGKTGVYFAGSQNCSALNGTSFANDGGGVVLALCRSCAVSSYNIDTWGAPVGAFAGIMLVGDTRYCTVTGNTIANGQGAGLGAIGLYQRTVGATPSPVFGLTYNAGIDAGGNFPYGASFNSITGNTIRSNAGIGIWLQPYSDFNEIVGNNISGSGTAGISVQAAQYNTIASNKIYNNTPPGIDIVSSSLTRPASHNRIYGNEIADVVVSEFTTLTGTASTHGTTALDTGVGTLFTTEIAGVGAVVPPKPIIISGEGIYNFVTNVASDTALTLQNVATTNSAGHTLSGPKIANQLTHPAVTQTTAIQERNVSGTQSDFNWIDNNKTTGAVTLVGPTTKIYAHQGGTNGRISATADVTTTANTTTDNDITGATTGTFTALETGSMIINAVIFTGLAGTATLAEFVVVKCQVSTNGGAFAAQAGTCADNVTTATANRMPMSGTWAVQLVAGNTYVVKLTVNNNTAVAGNNYTVFGATNATGFTYRFV